MRRPSVIPSGVTLRGHARGDADLVVWGSVEGDVELGGSLVVEEGGSIRGEVRARAITVRGVVVGDSFGTDVVRVEPGARVAGDLSAPRVTIVEGALFRGQVHITAAGPVPVPEPAFRPVPDTEPVPAPVPAPAPVPVPVLPVPDLPPAPDPEADQTNPQAPAPKRQRSRAVPWARRGEGPIAPELPEPPSAIDPPAPPRRPPPPRMPAVGRSRGQRRGP